MEELFGHIIIKTFAHILCLKFQLVINNYVTYTARNLADSVIFDLR